MENLNGRKLVEAGDRRNGQYISVLETSFLIL
jgi:hypothetical protein